MRSQKRLRKKEEENQRAEKNARDLSFIFIGVGIQTLGNSRIGQSRQTLNATKNKNTQ